MLRVQILLAISLLLMAPLAAAHERVSDSIAQLDARIANEPEVPEHHLRRGEFHRGVAAWGLARIDFERAGRLDPTGFHDFHIARLDLDLGELRQAEQALDRHLRRHPNHAEGWILQGRLNQALGRWPAAVDGYHRGLELVSGSERIRPEWPLRLARALVQAERHVDAIATLDEAWIRTGAEALRVEALEIEISLGRWDAALTRINEISSSKNRQERWLLRRAQVLAMADRHDEAGASLAAALVELERLSSARRSSPATQALEAELKTMLTRAERQR